MAAKTEKKDTAERQYPVNVMGETVMMTFAKYHNVVEQDKETMQQAILDNGHEKLKHKKERDELEAENFRLNGLVLESGTTTRTALLLALAPNMNLAYPREEAQRIEKTADEILKVWGV